MIEHLYLRNFKAFPKLELDFSDLTILSGLNSSGKTSVIQALLLIRQSNYQRKNLERLYLKGEDINIGKSNDALYEGASEDEIEFKLTIDDVVLLWLMEYIQDKDSLNYFKTNIDSPKELDIIRHSAFFKRNFQYLTAERIVPKAFYNTDDISVENKVLGSNGEFTAHFLHVHGQEFDISNPLLFHESQKSPNLLLQVEAWLNEFGPNHKIYTEYVPGSSFVSLKYSKGNMGNRRLPINVGFGLTYTLPVIVALLIAQKGDLLIIENPEAHLHPRGQTIIGKMAAYAASHGVQVILETHSDHVLYGARIAVKNAKISNEKVAIHFFHQKKDGDTYYSDKITVPLDKDGRLETIPDGFFDEFDSSLVELLIPRN